MYTVHQPSLLKACRIVGSQAALARRIGVSRARVNNWLNRGDKITYEYILAIEAATNAQVSRHDLAPSCLIADDHNSVPLHYHAHLKNIHEHLDQLFKQMKHLEKQLALLTTPISFDASCTTKELCS